VRYSAAVAIVFSLFFCRDVHAADAVNPKHVIGQIADAIEENYFDIARAREAASALRTDAAAGVYDLYADDDQLAAALTRRLKPLDGHFGVAPPSVATVDEPRLTIDYDDQVRRMNFGFRTVEVLAGNIGYIDLRFFPDIDFDAAESPERQAADAALQTLAHAEAVIIDLRDNGGGSPAMATYLASAFLPANVNAYMVERDGSGRETSLRPSQPYPRPRSDIPVIVMISARTASAAEALPYMLQSAGRAIVVGQPSMGAASVAKPIATPSGFSVFVPFAETISPLTNANWEGDGVQPDIAGPIEQAKNHAWILALHKVLERGLPEAIAAEDLWIIQALESKAVVMPLDSYPGRYRDAQVFIEHGSLRYKLGERPPWILRALSADLFTVEDEPTRRVRFNRDAQGRVTGLNVLWSEGSVSPTELRVD
jgi:hypothetical protein